MHRPKYLLRQIQIGIQIKTKMVNSISEPSNTVLQVQGPTVSCKEICTYSEMRVHP